MHKVDTDELPGGREASLRGSEAGQAVPVTHDGTVAARLSPVRDRRADAKSRLSELRTRAQVIDVITPLDWGG
jgi:antitoxin (DNA-binding transcriptional repressor) of toxin-antitoxin stability system